jgi:hypothetical protein
MRSAQVSDTTRTPTPRDQRHVAVLALLSLLALAFVGYLQMFVPSAFAPRVYVRWKSGVDDRARTENEQRLKLLAGEHYEGMTWAYDLADTSPDAIGAIVGDRSVDDTGNIDRSRLTIIDITRVGPTRIHGGLSLWRDASFVPWVTRLAFSFLLLSALWLATTGWPSRILRDATEPPLTRS